MRTLTFTLFAFSAFTQDSQAQVPRHIDVKNLFPNVGTVVLAIDPNGAGVPPGVMAAGSGTLIGEQVFLTAAHVTRPSEDGIPPFIHVFVTFNLHVLDDRSSWVPVVAQAWHPSSLPCPRNTCSWPDQPIPYPGLHDVGLMFLATPVKFAKPARLATPGALEQAEASNQPQVVVGYGYLAPPTPSTPQPMYRHYVEIPNQHVFDDIWSQGGIGEYCQGDSGGPVFLGPAGESGDKRRSVAALVSVFDGANCNVGKDFYARVDTEDVRAWINQEIKKFLSRP